jgi:HAD superfamily hydrolase (TIGR01450 family)
MLSPRDLPDRLRCVRHFVLDLDGTVYLGRKVFPWTNPFLALLRKLGLGFSFITNNNSLSTEEYLARLDEMGIQVARDSLYTSTLATIEYLRQEMPLARKLFILGTPSLRSELSAAGFGEAGEAPGNPPDAVIVGFDRTLTYERLCRAAYWIHRGKPFIATHPDRVCPTDEETVLVDCASICACLSLAAGREPDVVLGKPGERMILGLRRRLGLESGDLAVVGDRLYTDMKMARASGSMAVLVLSGETREEEAKRSREAVDAIVRDLGELGRLLQEALGKDRPP